MNDMMYRQQVKNLDDPQVQYLVDGIQQEIEPNQNLI